MVLKQVPCDHKQDVHTRHFIYLIYLNAVLGLHERMKKMN